jgi:hypothetical protein
MQLYRNLLLAGLIAALLACPLEADAALQATVDRQEVLPGETITLTLRQDELASAEEPDLRTLEQYFQILDIRRSQQVNIVNGYRTESMDWIIVLLPKDAAVTMIPPIRAGAATTAPIAISQVFPSDTDQDARPELFVEAEIEETEGFVGAEILYTVRVYDKGKMQSGTLRPPEVSGAEIESSGESTSSQVILDGERYNLYEQRFRITPEKPGSLKIAPAILEARMRPKPEPNRRRNRSFFGDFLDRAGQGGALRQVASNPITLEVQPRPDSTEGWFLPAKLVQLDEVWSAESGDLRLGDALTRTVSLRVLGATSEQLPTFVIPSPTGARQYAEGTREGTRPTDDGTISVREESVTIIAAEAGTLEFPAVEVKWFDVEAEEPRVASLPARSFEILPAVGMASAPLQPAESGIATPLTANDAPRIKKALALPGRTVAFALTALLAAIVLLTLLARRLRHRIQSPTETPRILARRVFSACRSSDPRQARLAFLKWAEIILPQPFAHSTVDIGERLGDEPLTAALSELNQSLYGRDPKPWSGKALAAAFRPVARNRKGADPNARSSPLPSLYPTS